MQLSDMRPEARQAMIERRAGLTDAQYVRLARLVADFRRAVERQRAWRQERDAEVLGVLESSTRFRELVVGIVDEVIKARIGVV
jgi:hypothetical protein